MKKIQDRIRLSPFIVFYFITGHLVWAGPVIRSSRMVREIYPEVEQEIPEMSQPQACIIGDSVYPSGVSVPSKQPCLQCTCLGPDVRCSTEICAAPPGCRATQQPGACCPRYHCDCEHEGRIYSNGERLPQTPGGECSVCYCRGGHVQCAEVGCYTRKDCEPKFVEGECCPKYDHCPPRDPLSDRLITQSSLFTSDPDLLSTLSQLNTSLLPLSSSEEGSGSDEEPRPTPITFSIKEIESKTSSKHNDIKVIHIDKSTQTDLDSRPQITIQEVTPPRTEFKISGIAGVVVSASPINPVITKDIVASTSSSLDILTDSSNELSDVESYASEKTEVYDHPPPVLRIGDQLLFIKQGQLVPEKDASTPSPVITLIGAEGLQIGLGSGEFTDHDVVTSEKTRTSEDPTETPTKIPETTTREDETSSSFEFSTVSSTREPEPVEYIPEENPYYPPIPEDIMNLGRDEATTDVSETLLKINKKSELPISITNREEISVIPLNRDRIFPDVLHLRNNGTILKNKSNEQWLKNSPTKISIPLLNERASLPDFLLEMTAPSDITTSEESISSTLGSTTTKLEKIVNQNENSKETMELNEDMLESGEFTTVPSIHPSLMASSEDASVEIIKNESSIDDDLVEIIPGFDKTTEKIIQEKTVEIIEDNSPKHEVEVIHEHTSQNTHEEIQKRDVVKKVLKDIFENPKENIRTDLIINTTPFPFEITGYNEDQNIVKPNNGFLSLNITKMNSLAEKSPKVTRYRNNSESLGETNQHSSAKVTN